MARVKLAQSHQADLVGKSWACSPLVAGVHGAMIRCEVLAGLLLGDRCNWSMKAGKTNVYTYDGSKCITAKGEVQQQRCQNSNVPFSRQ